MSRPVSVRTLYIDERVRGDLPEACRVFEVSDLLRELIIAAVRMPIEYDEAGRDGRVMRLILDEIAERAEHPAGHLDAAGPAVAQSVSRDSRRPGARRHAG